MKVAIVHVETTALAHTGKGFKLPAGRYEFVDIDGAEDSIGYVHNHHDGGNLACIYLHGPITIEETP